MATREISRRTFIGSSAAAAAGLTAPALADAPVRRVAGGAQPGPDVPWLAEVQQHTAPPGAPEPAALLTAGPAGQRITTAQG